MMRKYRKPIVVITPKIGLKSPNYISRIEDFTKENKFSAVLVDDFRTYKEKTKLVIFCSGQIFIEIKKQIANYEKENNKKSQVLVIRIEEIAPFPEVDIIEQLDKVSKDCKFFWVQEESMNSGCFTFLYPQLKRLNRNLKLNDGEIYYVGRVAQVGANGCASHHRAESENLGKEIKNILINN